jgi:hypothetical protein
MSLRNQEENPGKNLDDERGICQAWCEGRVRDCSEKPGAWGSFVRWPARTCNGTPGPQAGGNAHIT